MQNFVFSFASKNRKQMRHLCEYINLKEPMLQYSQIVHAVKRKTPEALWPAYQRAIDRRLKEIADGLYGLSETSDLAISLMEEKKFLLGINHEHRLEFLQRVSDAAIVAVEMWNRRAQ